MKQKFTTLALLYGFACSVPVYAVQYPTTANSDVRDLLCGSQEVVEALQPAKKDGWAHSVTITSATTTAIGDKAVLCNVQAVIKSKRSVFGNLSLVYVFITMAIPALGYLLGVGFFAAQKAIGF